MITVEGGSQNPILESYVCSYRVQNSQNGTVMEGARFLGSTTPHGLALNFGVSHTNSLREQTRGTESFVGPPSKPQDRGVSGPQIFGIPIYTDMSYLRNEKTGQPG